MQSYSLTHVSDAALLRDLATLIARDRLTTAEILAHIAEVDARRLYAPAGYSSMHAYCVGELRLSEDAAFKRIQAARAGRQFPELLAAVAEGKLHLAGACLLAPHLTREQSNELIQIASGKRKSEIEDWLATRSASPYSSPESLPFPTCQLAPGQVEDYTAPGADEAVPAIASGDIELAPGQVEPPRTRRAALLVRARLSRGKLRHAQALLSHAVPSGDVDEILDRALDALIHQLERRKIGMTKVPRRSGPSTRKRHIPAEIRRAVWERDRGQCTFVSANGKRCDERRFLEFDHIRPVARGGEATTHNIRLRCQTHNQYEAECAFGTDFMSQKRTVRRIHSESRVARETHNQVGDVLAGLRNLGCRPRDAHRAAEYAAALPVATLEERMRAALQFLGAKFVSRPLPAG